MTTRLLYPLVFVAGAATMSTEMSASRLLAPFFGSSILIWANIIGLILIYLSAGYFLGGRLADRRPEARLLGWIILVAALAVAATPFIARPILDLAVEGLDAVSVGALPIVTPRCGSCAGSCCLRPHASRSSRSSPSRS